MRIRTGLSALRTPSEPLRFIMETGLDKKETEDIVKKLTKTMDDNPSVYALAAPEIGIFKRVFCLRFSDGLRFFINPIVKTKKNYGILPESFASMPGKEILIARPQELTAVYYTEDLKYEDNKFINEAARLFDQQTQALDGILPDALGLVSDVASDGSLSELTESEMKQLIELYKKFVSTKKAALEKSLGTEEQQKAYRQLKFTEDVINGRTLLMTMPPKPTAKEQKAANRQQLAAFLSAKKKRGAHKA